MNKKESLFLLLLLLYRVLYWLLCIITCCQTLHTPVFFFQGKSCRTQVVVTLHFLRKVCRSLDAWETKTTTTKKDSNFHFVLTRMKNVV